MDIEYLEYEIEKIKDDLDRLRHEYCDGYFTDNEFEDFQYRLLEKYEHIQEQIHYKINRGYVLSDKEIMKRNRNKKLKTILNEDIRTK